LGSPDSIKNDATAPGGDQMLGPVAGATTSGVRAPHPAKGESTTIAPTKKATIDLRWPGFSWLTFTPATSPPARHAVRVEARCARGFSSDRIGERRGWLQDPDRFPDSRKTRTICVLRCVCSRSTSSITLARALHPDRAIDVIEDSVATNDPPLTPRSTRTCLATAAKQPATTVEGGAT
jgi:hypothetical protein